VNPCFHLLSFIPPHPLYRHTCTYAQFAKGDAHLLFSTLVWPCTTVVNKYPKNSKPHESPKYASTNPWISSVIAIWNGEVCLRFWLSELLLRTMTVPGGPVHPVSSCHFVYVWYCIINIHNPEVFLSLAAWRCILTIFHLVQKKATQTKHRNLEQKGMTNRIPTPPLPPGHLLLWAISPSPLSLPLPSPWLSTTTY